MTSSLGATDDAARARLHHAERTLTLVRWAGVVFAILQVLTYYRPYPGNMKAYALVVVAALALTNIVMTFVFRRPLAGPALFRASVGSLVADLMLVEALVFVFTFDVDTAIWAIIYILPLEGAIRFQARGALLVTAAASVLYAAREVFGNVVYDNPLLITSITFRMGIAFIIATVAGSTAASLSRERHSVQLANYELAEANRSIREFVSRASHEMRTPLTVISSGSRYMNAHWPTLADEQKREMVDAIDRQARSLDELVNEMLASVELNSNRSDKPH